MLICCESFARKELLNIKLEPPFERPAGTNQIEMLRIFHDLYGFDKKDIAANEYDVLWNAIQDNNIATVQLFIDLYEIGAEAFLKNDSEMLDMASRELQEVIMDRLDIFGEKEFDTSPLGSLDCSDEVIQTRELKRFADVKTMEEFFTLWGKFYLNQMCVPVTAGSFVGALDNPEATLGLGRLFDKITRFGLIPIDSQVNIPFHQKAYVIMFGTEDAVTFLSQELNRYPYVVAFTQDPPVSKKDTGCIHDLYVTYDGDDEDIIEGKKMGHSLGSPYTTMGAPMRDTLKVIGKYLNDDFHDEFPFDTFKQLTVVLANPQASPFYLFELINKILSRNRKKMKTYYPKLLG